MKYFCILILVLLIGLNVSCEHKPTSYNGQYPDDVNAILVNKCATAGCHNAQSYINAGNLRLDKWENLFAGSSNGAVAIPYNTGNSSLLYFINTDSTKGPVLIPRMPLDRAALSASEYAVICNWIAAGAPDKAGNVPFASKADTRQKVYISQQGCDLIAVVDAQSGIIMRYISVGMSPGIEVPHCVRFTSDGQFAYTSFTQGQYIQKIDAKTDAVVASLSVGVGGWNMFELSPDGTKMMLADFNNGIMQYIDLASMKIVSTFYDLVNPHAIASTPGFDTFFVTEQYGNTIYKMNLKGYSKKISIDGKDPNNLNQTYDPHAILMSPDHSKYFVTCQASNEVRVMDAHSDTLIQSILVGTFPQELVISKSYPYILVSCEEDINADYPAFKGSVYIINYNTYKVEKRIYGPFYQIHGIAVDDQDGLIYIASRNLQTSGPAPHHTSVCGGRNGYYSIYDLNTFLPHDSKRYESTVDPYSADVRFK
jgi:DNA-binding beta-propeller fold protein YncE